MSFMIGSKVMAMYCWGDGTFVGIFFYKGLKQAQARRVCYKRGYPVQFDIKEQYLHLNSPVQYSLSDSPATLELILGQKGKHDIFREPNSSSAGKSRLERTMMAIKRVLYRHFKQKLHNKNIKNLSKAFGSALVFFQ